MRLLPRPLRPGPAGPVPSFAQWDTVCRYRHPTSNFHLTSTLSQPVDDESWDICESRCPFVRYITLDLEHLFLSRYTERSDFHKIDLSNLRSIDVTMSYRSSALLSQFLCPQLQDINLFCYWLITMPVSTANLPSQFAMMGSHNLLNLRSVRLSTNYIDGPGTRWLMGLFETFPGTVDLEEVQLNRVALSDQFKTLLPQMHKLNTLRLLPSDSKPIPMNDLVACIPIAAPMEDLEVIIAYTIPSFDALGFRKLVKLSSLSLHIRRDCPIIGLESLSDLPAIQNFSFHSPRLCSTLTAPLLSILLDGWSGIRKLKMTFHDDADVHRVGYTRWTQGLPVLHLRDLRMLGERRPGIECLWIDVDATCSDDDQALTVIPMNMVALCLPFSCIGQASVRVTTALVKKMFPVVGGFVGGFPFEAWKPLDDHYRSQRHSEDRRERKDILTGFRGY